MVSKRESVSRETRELVALTRIREIVGCGHKPMISELIQYVQVLVDIAQQVRKEHDALRKFSAGFGKAAPCSCMWCNQLEMMGVKLNEKPVEKIR